MEGAKDIQARARIIVHKRTGALMESIDARYDGDDALVGPTDSARSKNGPYGRFIELGGIHRAHNPSGYMWWEENGSLRRAKVLVKGPHAYLEPATDQEIGSGDLTRIYFDRWLIAQDTAT